VVINGARNYANSAADADGAEWSIDTLGGTADNRSDFGFLLGHQGLRLDTETGAYYNRARYLQSGLGTFGGRDPVPYVDGFHLYQYQVGSPVNLTDPSGEIAPAIYLAVVGIAALLSSTAEAPTSQADAAGAKARQQAQTAENVKTGAALATCAAAPVGGAALAARAGLSGTAAGLTIAGTTGMANGLVQTGLDAAINPDMTAGELATDFSLNFGVGALLGGLQARGLINPATSLPDDGLVHLTNNRGAAGITESGVLRGNNYAGPLSNAGESGLGITRATGMSPSSYQAAVRIPPAAEAAFTPVRPIGPISSWQAVTGQQYTANGALNLSTGAFTRHGVNWNQTAIYGFDAAFMTGSAYYLGTKIGD
jgi:RHS repeat-associated protein